MNPSSTILCAQNFNEYIIAKALSTAIALLKIAVMD